MLKEQEQIKQLISDKKYILVALPQNADEDALAASVAVKSYLEKQKKQAEIVSSGFVAPKNLNFILKSAGIKPDLSNLHKFIIKVDVSKSPIDSLSYDVKDNTLSIYLAPKYGAITKNELRTAQSSFKYDLIITIGATELETLGNIFQNNTDLFFNTPIINIDHRLANDHFGQINLINSTATSCSEIIFQTFSEIFPDASDKNIATAILTGMIAKTNSFKSPGVTPQVLNLAGQLIKQGADRESIIQNLFRTKSLSMLQLWGQALTHIAHDRSVGLVWTSVTRDDYSRTGTTDVDLKGVIDELLLASPDARVVLIFSEMDGGVKVTVTAEKERNAKELIAEFEPIGDKSQAHCTLNKKSLKEAEELIVSAIKSKLQN